MGQVLEPGVWGSRLARVPGGLRQRGPADPYVEAMRSTRSERDRLVLATRALRKDPDCIEANLVVAAHCRDEDMRLAYLNIAVEAGDLMWLSPGVRSVVGSDWAAVPGALPWLQAIKALGEAAERAGDVETAQDCYGRLLEMDPADGQCARAGMDRVRGAPAPGM